MFTAFLTSEERSLTSSWIAHSSADGLLNFVAFCDLEVFELWTHGDNKRDQDDLVGFAKCGL